MSEKQNLNNSTNQQLDIVDNSKRFWLYKPKYNEKYNDVDEDTKNEILQTEGGIWQIYDHKPSKKELQQAFLECYL